MTTPDILASIEAAKNASMLAMTELESAHSKLRLEYDRLGERILHLWRLPLQRDLVLSMLLDAVDTQGQTFPTDMGWDTLFAHFVRPAGDRPIVSKRASLSESRSYRPGPLALSDLVALGLGRGNRLVKLENMLMSEREQAGGVLPGDAIPEHGFRHPANERTPASFLGLWGDPKARQVTQHQLVAALCFFMGDAIKARLRAAFDHAVPADWPTRPDGVSASDWRLTPDERMHEIEAADGRRAELLKEMRRIDAQSYTLAPQHDLGKVAAGRATLSDDAY
jgi:hypothetical protein